MISAEINHWYLKNIINSVQENHLAKKSDCLENKQEWFLQNLYKTDAYLAHYANKNIPLSKICICRLPKIFISLILGWKEIKHTPWEKPAEINQKTSSYRYHANLSTSSTFFICDQKLAWSDFEAGSLFNIGKKLHSGSFQCYET